jgi:hypothetical protein
VYGLFVEASQRLESPLFVPLLVAVVVTSERALLVEILDKSVVILRNEEGGGSVRAKSA